jgi:hypothetical protein
MASSIRQKLTPNVGFSLGLSPLKPFNHLSDFFLRFPQLLL